MYMQNATSILSLPVPVAIRIINIEVENFRSVHYTRYMFHVSLCGCFYIRELNAYNDTAYRILNITTTNTAMNLQTCELICVNIFKHT